MSKEKREMLKYSDLVYSYEGIATGKAVKILRNINENDINTKKIDAKDIKNEINRLRDAVFKLKEREEKFIKLRETEIDKDIKSIGEAYILLISEIEYKTIEKINKDSINAEYAVLEIINEIKNKFWSIQDDYLRERIHDLDIIKNQIITKLVGIQTLTIEQILNSIGNKEEIIIVADEIMPSDFSLLKQEKRITGIILAKGGKTSHMAIMAKNLKLPTILGAAHIINNIKPEDYLIIDTYEKVLIINPTKEILKEYNSKKIYKEKEYNKIISDIKNAPITKDNVRIKVMANIEIESDLEKVVEFKADGVGLYRTEFIFINEENIKIPISFLSDEEKQFKIYKSLVEKVGDILPIIIRTFDFEKGQILEESQEKNPVLGMRSIRYCIKNLDIFRHQLRAILRASHYGYIKILFPMITSNEELQAIKTYIEYIKRELESIDEYFDEKIEIGVMLEVPALGFIIDIIKEEVDFIAIGTNDLLQYFLAVDRSNLELNKLYNPYSISFLRFLSFISSQIKDKEVYICGEITSDPFFVIFYLGLGFRSFSVPLYDIPKVKHIIKNISIKDCEEFAKNVLTLKESYNIYQEFETFYKKNFKEKLE